jgi:hypothetical protein
MEVYAPGGRNSKHGHMNSAVFFVLKGKGHDVHDGRRYDWEAGDAMIVENACVHQHFSDEADDECILLVMKAKPLFLFMHMLFQKVAEFPSKVATSKELTFVPPGDLQERRPKRLLARAAPRIDKRRDCSHFLQARVGRIGVHAEGAMPTYDPRSSRSSSSRFIVAMRPCRASRTSGSKPSSCCDGTAIAIIRLPPRSGPSCRAIVT